MIRRLILGLGLCMICLLANPLHASAFDPFGSVPCTSDNTQSAVCTDKGNGTTDPIAGPDGILSKATTLIATVAGVAAIIVILVGSINYITAGGDSGNLKSARSMVIYSLVGLIIIIIVRSIIVFVINHLVKA